MILSWHKAQMVFSGGKGMNNNMNLRPDEITGIIKEQIRDYSSKLELSDTGTVVTAGDGISWGHGLEQ